RARFRHFANVPAATRPQPEMFRLSLQVRNGNLSRRLRAVTASLGVPVHSDGGTWLEHRETSRRANRRCKPGAVVRLLSWRAEERLSAKNDTPCRTLDTPHVFPHSQDRR